eukprot:COSAG05_NODE_24316_length_252_cov_0.679739_1_plen_34_part_10
MKYTLPPTQNSARVRARIASGFYIGKMRVVHGLS